MFSWFHKKNTSSIVAETLINSDSCSQSFEHYTLSKIHELQTERDNINNELKELNNTNSLETPEFDKYAQHLAAHMSKDFNLDMMYRQNWIKSYGWKNYAARLLEQAIVHCSYEVDFTKLAYEVTALNKNKEKIVNNKNRLKQIDAELQALKKSLNIE